MPIQAVCSDQNFIRTAGQPALMGISSNVTVYLAFRHQHYTRGSCVLYSGPRSSYAKHSDICRNVYLMSWPQLTTPVPGVTIRLCRAAYF